MNEAQRDVALFRYSLIREMADESLTTRQRGPLVRALAAADHAGPHGRQVKVARGTIDRWIRVYRKGGFEALAPVLRRGELVTEQRLLDLAETLKLELPRRTAAQVTQIIRTTEGQGPSERTIQRHFARLGLNTRPDGSPPVAFGRFEAAAPGDLWTGDALHGPAIGGRKTYLFAFIDDHSRALVGYRWGHSEDTVRLEAAFRAALASRGVPRSVYLDNGSAMVSKQLLRACASLGVRLVHSKPGRPEGRGKIERVFKTVRMQFLVEIEAQSTLCRLGGDRLSPAGPFRDRRGPHRPVAGRRDADPPDSCHPSRGVLVVRGPHRDQDGDRLPARQHLRGRCRTGGIAGGGGL
jgi:putative transposase